jgi:uncharacterized protein with GYD domain
LSVLNEANKGNAAPFQVKFALHFSGDEEAELDADAASAIFMALFQAPGKKAADDRNCLTYQDNLVWIRKRFIHSSIDFSNSHSDAIRVRTPAFPPPAIFGRGSVNRLFHWLRGPQRNEKGGLIMATYITLVNFTKQGIGSIKESPKRLDMAKEMFQSLGGELKAFYLVMGRYDMVVVGELPNDEAAAKAALAIGSQGDLKTETFRAFNESEYRNIITALP